MVMMLTQTIFYGGGEDSDRNYDAMTMVMQSSMATKPSMLLMLMISMLIKIRQHIDQMYFEQTSKHVWPFIVQIRLFFKFCTI